ncbi:MAG TPA: hypothetical protein VJW20_14115 [Candidatus Angelobacter sp.]|nr:hypothetical protein [Candidatus Angelobacter sp.]
MPATKPAKEKPSAARAKAEKPDLAPVFAALREMLKRFIGKDLAVQTDKPGNYHLECPSILHRKKPLYFAGVRTGKNYVSFHLICAYFNPAMTRAMSPALKKRKQGKACFNFTQVDPECFAELKRLAEDGLKIFKSEKFRQRIQQMQ